jgi:3-oxoadipate enol-lactonase
VGRIKILQQEIYFAARGESGAPLVFIHGAGDSHLVWNGQLAAFADIARTFALDLPGHGRSTGAGCTTIAGYATVVREFLDGLQLERAVLAGASMGGAIAQTLALETPERVTGLVLVGTGAKLRVAPQILKGLDEDFENAARELVEYFFAPSPPAPLLSGEEREVEVLKEKSFRQLLATGHAVVTGDFVACDAFDERARSREISAPTLVVCGREDKMTPLKYSEYLAQQIPHAQLAVIEQAGHMVMLEQPAAFNDALRQWLATQ